MRFSVLIPVRNEAPNLTTLLRSLAAQDYPAHAFEVILINDHSTDTTVEQIESLRSQLPFSLRLLHLPDGVTQKKAALQQGITAARFPLLVTTDGDCRVPPYWLASFAGFYRRHRSALISGGVCIRGEKSFFHHFQTVEFASLIGTGGSLLGQGIPTMANGANLCYEKAAFRAVGGFEGNWHIPSGDDEFLLRKIARRYPRRVHFLKSRAAVVRTRPQASWSAFVAQRRRWAGKWNVHRDRVTPLLAVGVFGFHLLHLLTWLLFFITFDAWLLTGILIKVGLEFALLRIWLHFLGADSLATQILPTQLLHSAYVVLFGGLAQKKTYHWKGRRSE